MIIIPEMKKMAGLNDRCRHLAEIISEKIDADGLLLNDAYLISGCSVKGKHLYQNGCRLDNYGLTDDLYYCEQYSGYCEDSFYGRLYFKTDVPGQYVVVPFDM